MKVDDLITQLTSSDSQYYLQENLSAQPDKLLFKKNHQGLPIKELVHQIKCRQKAKDKLPSWSEKLSIIFPPTVSVEQCSSELTADYKAQIITQGNSFADLTGGMGIDFLALSTQFESNYYIEENPELVALAKHNFLILGTKNYTIKEEKAETFLQTTSESFDLIYIDPHRRDDTNKKLVSLQDCVPDVTSMLDALFSKSQQVLIKASPMLEIKQALRELRHVKEIHIVSVKNECKEVLFLLERGFEQEPIIQTANITTEKTEQFHFTYSEEDALINTVSEEKQYIYLPNSSITKSGGFKSLSDTYSLSKLHKQSHVYTSDQLITDFPGRTYTLLEAIPYAQAKKRMKELQILSADIIIRNFKDDISQIRKKTNVKKEGKNLLLASTNQEGKMTLYVIKKTLLTK